MFLKLPFAVSFSVLYIYIYIWRDMPKVLGSNPGECLIFYLFRCVLSFSATLAKRRKVQFRLGFAINTATLNLITACEYPHNTMLYISMYIYIYIYIYIYQANYENFICFIVAFLSGAMSYIYIYMYDIAPLRKATMKQMKFS